MDTMDGMKSDPQAKYGLLSPKFRVEGSVDSIFSSFLRLFQVPNRANQCSKRTGRAVS